jgi:putative transposase
MSKIKQFSSREIISWYLDNDANDFLKAFKKAAIATGEGNKYQVWQKRFDNFVITDDKDMLIKLDYIHNNPLQDRWRLRECPEDYSLSSARYYVKGEDCGLTIEELG